MAFWSKKVDCVTLDLNGRVGCVSYSSACVYAVSWRKPQDLETVSFLKLPDSGISPKSMGIDGKWW